MSETTAIIVMVSITIFVIVTIGLLCIASLKEDAARMRDPLYQVLWRNSDDE